MANVVHLCPILSPLPLREPPGVRVRGGERQPGTLIARESGFGTPVKSARSVYVCHPSPQPSPSRGEGARGIRKNLTAILAVIFCALLPAIPAWAEPAAVPAAKPVINSSLAYLATLAADCAKKKPGAFESADAIAKRLIEHDGLPEQIPADIEERAIKCMLEVYVLKPERNNVYRYLAQAPIETASTIAEKTSKQRLAQLLLARVDFHGEAASDVNPLFGMQMEDVAAAARSTLWPFALPDRGAGNLVEQVSAFNGRVAKNVLCLQPGNNKTVSYITVFQERLYLFETSEEEGGQHLVINRGAYAVRQMQEGNRRMMGRMSRPRRNDTNSTYMEKPSPIAGLAVVKLGERRDGLMINGNQPQPEWLRQFIPENFELGVEYVKTEPPTIVKPAATQPAYVKPSEKPAEKPVEHRAEDHGNAE